MCNTCKTNKCTMIERATVRTTAYKGHELNVMHTMYKMVTNRSNANAILNNESNLKKNDFPLL